MNASACSPREGRVLQRGEDPALVAEAERVITEGQTDAIDQAPASLRPYLRLWQVCSPRSKETPHTTTPVNDATYREPSESSEPRDQPDQDAPSLSDRLAHLERKLGQLVDAVARLEHVVNEELSTPRMFERVEGIYHVLAER